MRLILPLSLLAIGFGAYLLCSALRDVTWRFVAHTLARPRVTAWLIARYAVPSRAFPIVGPSGDLYMERFIIFNRGGGSAGSGNDGPVQFPWIPFSIRLHRIARPDDDRALHDHPAAFRSICLRGWYEHETLDGDIEVAAGETYVMRKGMFHRIFSVPDSGVWTLVIFGKRDTTWGFLVNGHKVPYQEYLASKPAVLTAADWDYVRAPDEERRA